MTDPRVVVPALARSASATERDAAFMLMLYDLAKAGDVDAAKSLINELGRRADNGSEESAVILNDVVASFPPELLTAVRLKESADLACSTVTVGPLDAGSEPTLGEILGRALAAVNDDRRQLIDGAIGLIASHYGMHPDDVADVVWDLEAKLWADTGLECFGRALEAPHGFAVLGMRVAMSLWGVEAAEAFSPLPMQIH